MRQAELVFVAAPSTHMEVVGDALCPHLNGSHMMVHVSRGIVGDELTTVCEVLRSRTPVRRVGVLAGPLVADALAEGAPSGGIVGTLFPEVAEAVTEAIGGERLRIYTTQDVVGVELSAAFVGLVALALGFAQAQKLGPSTLAVLGVRGLAEGARVAERFGASERTFAGLAGAGDVMAAIAGDKRPETAFGRALAQGVDADGGGQDRRGVHRGRCDRTTHLGLGRPQQSHRADLHRDREADDARGLRCRGHARADDPPDGNRRIGRLKLRRSA